MPAPQPDLLTGNWLLLGQLPSFGLPPIGTTPPSGLALTFSVSGDTINAGGAFSFPCSAGAVAVSGGFGGDLRGTIAADGSFQVGTQVRGGDPPGVSLSIKGVVPRTAGGAWTGDYVVTTTGQDLCPLSQNGTFTAQPIAEVHGVYVGTGLSTFVGGPPASTSKPLPLTVALTLSQGGTLHKSGAAPIANSALALSGSLSVQGIPCFSKGIISATENSEVSGSRVSAIFDVDDGAQVSVQVYLADTSADSLALATLNVRGGKCDGVYFLQAGRFLAQRTQN